MKWKDVRKKVAGEGIQMLCIQETKKEDIVQGVCYVIWGSKEVKWGSVTGDKSSGRIILFVG